MRIWNIFELIFFIISCVNFVAFCKCLRLDMFHLMDSGLKPRWLLIALGSLSFYCVIILWYAECVFSLIESTVLYNCRRILHFISYHSLYCISAADQCCCHQIQTLSISTTSWFNIGSCYSSTVQRMSFPFCRISVCYQRVLVCCFRGWSLCGVPHTCQWLTVCRTNGRAA